jgi:hypothetical protein
MGTTPGTVKPSKEAHKEAHGIPRLRQRIIGVVGKGCITGIWLLVLEKLK